MCTPKPPKLWDWLYSQSPRGPDYMRGLGRGDIKRKYYEVSVGRRSPTPVDLWIMHMVGEYASLLRGEVPDNFPVGHQFERIADIRTANFNRKESAMNPDMIRPAPQDPFWQAAGVPHQPSPEDRIKQGEAIIAQAEADLAERIRREELAARIDSETNLAKATQQLLNHIRDIALGGHAAQLVPAFAQFRKELAPLAETYGFRIVLVGDKSVAVLTQ